MLGSLLILGERHLDRIVKDAKRVAFFNLARPHQGIAQRIPEAIQAEEREHPKGESIALPVLNGLHHDYRRAA